MKKLFTFITLLMCYVGGVKAADVAVKYSNATSVTLPTNNYFSAAANPKDDSKGELTTNSGNFRYNVPANTAATVTFTFTAKADIELSSFTFNSKAGAAGTQNVTVSYFKGSETATEKALTFDKNNMTNETVTPASAIALSANEVFTIKVAFNNTTEKQRNWDLNTITLAATIPGQVSLSLVGSTTRAMALGSETAINVSAENTSGSETYQWYKTTSEDTDCESGEAITGQTTATFTPNEAAAGTYYYYCVLTDGANKEKTSLITVYTVAPLTGWVVFDGLTDTELRATTVTNAGVSMTYETSATALTDVSGKTNTTDRYHQKAINLAKSESSEKGGYLSFTIPTGYQATSFKWAFSGTGNRTIFLATKKITKNTDDGYIATLSSGVNNVVGGEYAETLEAGTYYIREGGGGAWHIDELAFTLEEVVKTQYDTPTITVGDFNFEHKGYEVTITGEETLQVSVDGAAYEVKTSPYVTYVTTTNNLKAKATGEGLADSEVAEKNVENTFDAAKPYVAWVYTKGYGSASYAFATDRMVAALQADYNVVEVNYAESVTPSTDLNNADLIVCTEAMTGNKTMSNGMVAFVGTTPMIGLKFFNYTKDASKNRWGWGAPANPSSTTLGFTPNSTLYKVLEGVTYESDGTIKLATQSLNDDKLKNVVQTITFSDAPAGNVNMGTADGKVAMHCATKYFGLGLSSDCWQYYTANAITIVKNAAAMLIAGEALDAKKTAVNITTTKEYSTYVTAYDLDFSATTVEAYVATATADSKVTLQAVTSAPKGTPLLLKGIVNEDVPLTATPTAIETNLLVAGPADLTGDGSEYVLKDGAFHKAKAGSLAAGKAYLKVPTAANGLVLTFSFGETTGIETVALPLRDAQQVYNLAGQRVGQPTKGLYIVNGKKVVVK